MKKRDAILACVVGALAAVLAALLVNLCVRAALADDGVMDMWVLCQPGSEVNIRGGAGTASAITGTLVLGDRVQVDKSAGEWWHGVELSNESGDGWIHSGYLVGDEPTIYPDGQWCIVVGNGRVAARRSMDGERRMWITPSETAFFRVWARTDVWCVTDAGFIRSEYLQEVPRD